MQKFTLCLFFICIEAIFSSSKPPWSCALSSSSLFQKCLNPRTYGSLILYDTSGNIIGHGISGDVRSFSGFGSFPQLVVKTFAAPEELKIAHNATIAAPQEYVVAEKLKHFNIVTTYDILFDGEYWHQVMEHVPSRLQELVLSGSLSPSQIDSIFTQVVEGVAYMHAMGIAHLDLKLTNIMVTERGVPKLIDFGSSYFFKVNGDLNTSQVQFLVGEYGALSYSAPEVLDGLPYDPRLADVWALGVTYVCMTTGCPWTQARYHDESFSRFALRGPSTLVERLPERSRSIIEMMLAIEPERRMTMTEVLTALSISRATNLTAFLKHDSHVVWQRRCS